MAAAASRFSPSHANIITVLDTDLLGEFEKLPKPSAPAPDPTDHIKAREWLETIYKPMPKTPKPTCYARCSTPVKIRDVTVSYGSDDHFNVRVYEPEETATPTQTVLPAILAFHGGGWIHGYSALEDDAYTFMASETRSVVFGVDYRLAPEFAFPVAHNDSYEALNYVIGNAQEYRVDIQRIALWGCSAGGNLVAGVALRDAREYDPPRIRHASLIVPPLCPPSLAPALLSVPMASYTYLTAQRNALTLTGVEKLWEMYAGGCDKLNNPYVSPLLALPALNHCPMYVVVAGADVLRDDGIAYALQYRNAGCDVHLNIIPGAPHGLTAAPEAWASKQYWRDQIRVLNVALHTNL